MSSRTRERGSHAAAGRRARAPHGRPPQRNARRRVSRATRLTIFLSVLAVGIVIVGIVSGFDQEPSAEPTVQAFLLDVQQGQYGAAAALTTGQPDSVVTTLGSVFGAGQQLDATAVFLGMGSIAQHGDTAEASFNASVDLAEMGRQWDYQGRFPVRRVGSTWKVVWSPSDINPALGQGDRLAVVTQEPDRASVLDSQEKPLQVPSSTYVVGVWPGRLADPAKTAMEFANATGLNSQQVLGQIRAAPPKDFLKLLTLQAADFHRLLPKLERVPGPLRLQVPKERLFQSFASEVVGAVGTETSGLLRSEGASYQPGTTVGLSGLEKVDQTALAGSAATEVVVVNSAGRQVAVLERWPGMAGTPVHTTIDSTVQSAAAAALNAHSGAGEIIVTQPSTGDILAVADHSGGGISVPGVLNARLTPGMAFTIVSTAALLQTGFSANTAIQCTSATAVGGQTFTEPTSLTTGTQTPFSTDFAAGCPTAFAGLSRRLSGTEFAKVVQGFGLGSSWGLPLATFSGKAPASLDDGDLAAETIGQGGVQVSPLGMAMVAADVASGVVRSPVLVVNPSDPAAVRAVPLSASSLDVLRTLMRKTVQSGAGEAAQVSGASVYGQVGLVQTGTGSHRIWESWFVGYRGDLAFTVIEFGKTAQLSAAALTAEFLHLL
jgi:cell division protein FtsI/penicillin-binding protein 2